MIGIQVDPDRPLLERCRRGLTQDALAPKGAQVGTRVVLEPRPFPKATARSYEGAPRLVIRKEMPGSPYPVGMPASTQHIATQLLGDVGTRLSHTRRVVGQASMVSDFLADRWSHAVIDAAWLHDIGHSPAVSNSGFHALDGARWLRAEGFSEDTCSLVAWHTGAIHEARERGLEDELRAEFAQPALSALDALTWADLTSSPSGDLVSPEARLNEIIDRYEPGSPVALAITAGLRDFRQSTENIERLLEARDG